MELTTKNVLDGLATVHGDKSAHPDGGAAMHQNASNCITNDAAGLPKPPPDAGESAAPTTPVELSPQKVKAISLLLGGKTYTQAAHEIGVDRTTIYRWRREAEFVNAMQRRLAETFDVVTLRTRAALLRSSFLMTRSLEGEQQVQWAFKVINSKRVWDIGNTIPPLPAEG